MSDTTQYRVCLVCTKGYYGKPHHEKHRGSTMYGAWDIPENEFNLCPHCHTGARHSTDLAGFQKYMIKKGMTEAAAARIIERMQEAVEAVKAEELYRREVKNGLRKPEKNRWRP